MLKVNAFANAVAAVSVLFTFIMWVLSQTAPEFFKLVYNSQFVGADVASLYSKTADLTTLVVTLVVVGVTGWIVGYVWITLYNYWAK